MFTSNPESIWLINYKCKSVFTIRIQLSFTSLVTAQEKNKRAGFTRGSRYIHKVYYGLTEPSQENKQIIISALKQM